MGLPSLSLTLPVALSAVAVLVSPAASASQSDTPKATISVVQGTMKAAPGQTFPVAVIIDLESHWHINTNRPEIPAAVGDSEDYIPTTIHASASVDGRLVPNLTGVQWPAPTMATAGTKDGLVEYGVYEGRVIAYLPVSISADASPGLSEITVRVGYQACNEQVCLAPVEERFDLKVSVDPTAAGWPADGIYPEHFTAFDRTKLAASSASTPVAEGSRDLAAGNDAAGLSALAVSMIVAGAAFVAILIAVVVVRKVL